MSDGNTKHPPRSRTTRIAASVPSTAKPAALARSGLFAVAEATTAMLSVRTLADAIEIQAGFARRGNDAVFDGSARLSEIAAKATAEASRPIMAELDNIWRGVA